jgi:hypothetical protein
VGWGWGCVCAASGWCWPSLSWGSRSQSGRSSTQLRSPPPRRVNKLAGIRLSGLFQQGSADVWRGAGGRVSAPGVERAGRCLMRLVSVTGAEELNAGCLSVFGGSHVWLCRCVLYPG